jgi:hypothetical protein
MHKKFLIVLCITTFVLISSLAAQAEIKWESTYIEHPIPGQLQENHEIAAEVERISTDTGHPVHLEFYENEGGIKFLYGHNLLPEATRSSTLTKRDAISITRSLFKSNPALFGVRCEDAREVPWRIASITPPTAFGYQTIRVRQMYGPLMVKDGELVLTTINGRLVSVAGKLFPPGDVPQPRHQLRAKALVDEDLKSAYGTGYMRKTRYFDASRGVVVSEYEHKKNQGERIVWDEKAREEIERYSTAHYGYTERDTVVREYYNAYNTFEGSTQVVTTEFQLTSYLYSQYETIGLEYHHSWKNGQPQLCYAEPGATNLCVGAKDILMSGTAS